MLQQVREIVINYVILVVIGRDVRGNARPQNSTSMTDRPPTRPRRPTRDIPPLPTELRVDDDAPSTLSLLPHPSAAALTPLRAHYLKKSLIQLQFDRELDHITSATPQHPNISTLSYLGPPFTPPPKDTPHLDLPFLRYVFRQFVLTFPFMATAPKDFYSDKLQPFVASLLSRNLSLFVGSGTKLVESEEVVRLKQSDLDRLEALANKRLARQMKHKDIFEVNIVCVRTVIDKGRVRSRVHEVSCPCSFVPPSLTAGICNRNS